MSLVQGTVYNVDLMYLGLQLPNVDKRERIMKEELNVNLGPVSQREWSLKEEGQLEVQHHKPDQRTCHDSLSSQQSKTKN